MTLPSPTAPPSQRAYRIRCPVCGAEPQRVCREGGRDMRDVHAARASEIVETWTGESPSCGRVTCTLDRYPPRAPGMNETHHYTPTSDRGLSMEIKTVGLTTLESARSFAIDMGYACRDVPMWTREVDGALILPLPRDKAERLRKILRLPPTSEQAKT